MCLESFAKQMDFLVYSIAIFKAYGSNFHFLLAAKRDGSIGCLYARKINAMRVDFNRSVIAIISLVFFYANTVADIAATECPVIAFLRASDYLLVD